MPSLVIESFSYHADRRQLEVLFTTGRRYVYHDVPAEAAEGLRASFSKGRHFNRQIRGNYRFTEISD